MHGNLAEWTREVVEVLTREPGPLQLQSLASWLRRLCVVDHFVLFVYEGDYRPLSLFDTFPPDLRKIFVDEYQTGPYLLDPFYLTSQRFRPEGLYSMRKLAPDQFYASEYFRSYYHHLGMCEEIGFFTPVDEGGGAVLSLMRRRGSVPYSSEEIRLLSNATAAVHAVVRAAWAASREMGPRAIYDRDHLVREAFSHFGRRVLTERECEVARLLLQGHSNLSVAQCLGISSGTVKVHRKNLYEKLGIGSQSELLALFISELKGTQAP
ncbi:TPA: helix-turn-helix transcriptional regulator [Pseudomonas aeruginosa]|uniref:response regulator transcription factor n=1 Tax=Pseudomonas paraeruginosa TaxID=2994495 RepID=UPI00374A3515|nr:helix-turn-helix transcriptional regulator [Pseudomonas aeruginosa]